MGKYKETGWGKCCHGYPWYNEENQYPLQAYSEFMPPLRTGINQTNGNIYPWVLSEDDMFGWQVHEMEEEYQLRPGLDNIGNQLMENMVKLGQGSLPIRLAGHEQRNLKNNLFWTEELFSFEGLLKHERYISFIPLSLSKTKDDKGRVRWTFFGASEQGPEKAFWKSFYLSPDVEAPESAFLAVMQWIFKEAWDIQNKNAEQLIRSGFRILPAGNTFPIQDWHMQSLPGWTKKYLTCDHDDFGNVKYLLTFRPFGKLPSAVKERYLAGKLSLIPFPGSMIPWGIPEYIKLQEKLYNAIQIPMLRLVKRHEETYGIRVPQSGWLHQPKISGEKAEILEEFIVDNYVRTSRWDKFNKHEDALINSAEIDPVMETLFSTNLASLDLYNKPMARNCQLFSEKLELLLDGPGANRVDIGKAALKALEGGLFRYRFYFPAMQVGFHEIFWQRPMLACLSCHSGKPEINKDLLHGYLTGYDTRNPVITEPVELWPRLLRDDLRLSVLNNFNPLHDHYLHQTSLNLFSLLDSYELFDKRPLEQDFARNLVRIPENETLDQWLATFPDRSLNRETGKKITLSISSIIKPQENHHPFTEFLTYKETATRTYEEAYWNQISCLAHGAFTNKDNADVVMDQATRKQVTHNHRDLHKLGDYLIKKYQKAIADAGMINQAEVGELPFAWETDFKFIDFGGWVANQDGSEYERNILVIIPGKNRTEAVVMADHYDTAYMADVFDTSAGGSGARLSAAGADDNYSATSTLVLAAPIFLKMAKEGRLEKDIWLLHLTGEEFPSDCMGARNFCRHIVQKTLKMKRGDASWLDLSTISVSGVLVMDMIAHNRDTGRNIFQISPGRTDEALHLAYQAHKANMAWNNFAKELNLSADRKDCTTGKRSTDTVTIPKKALHLIPKGEIRTWDDPYSSLYNTDGMIFSDTGIPVILFMENYDINRTGYHDTHDTMENIDLDYGAAVSAIAIETIARLACIQTTIAGV